MRMVKQFASTLALSLCALSITAPAFAQAAAVASNTRVWVGRVPEIEKFLKEADIVGTEDIGVGVTKPRKATLVPGGPVEAIAWKPINPGRYSGYWESYKSEIAAYELDKLLDLGMVPPTVEKDLKGVTGAAVMWCPSVQSFKQLGGVPGLNKGVKGPPPVQIPAWIKQITIAKMFDNLIGNIDPNLGNWLVDAQWNLILIDHTRAFTNTRDLYHQLVQIDEPLWAKMSALDEAGLTAALGAWLDKGQIKAMLQRRDKMQAVISKLPKVQAQQ